MESTHMASSQASSGRQEWMDVTRGVCIVLVLFVHTSAALELAGAPYPAGLQAFNDFFDPFRMPLLMFLSGMLLERSLIKSARRNIEGKLSLIFWPFLVWSVVVYAAEDRLTVENLLKTPISAPSLLWYLWFLCAYYLLTILILRLRVPLVPVLCLCIIGSELLPDFIRMARFASLYFFFLLGHLVATKFMGRQESAIFAMLGLTAAVAGGIFSSVVGPIKYEALFVGAPLGLIVFVLWASKHYRTSTRLGWLKWVGRNSMTFYVAHFPIQVVLAGHVHEGLSGAPYIAYFVVFMASMLGAAGIQLARRIQVVDALFNFRSLRRLLPSREAKTESELLLGR